MQSSYHKVLAIGGLRGTGKTVGLLQAVRGLDACYLLADKNETETADDYVYIINNTDKQYILIDEYGFIQDREKLDEAVYRAVTYGKRIAITGDDSVALDFLNVGTLIHRVEMIHVTLFTYEEYCRIYSKNPSKETCLHYLSEGGVFQEYAITNFTSMKNYIKTAIIDNIVHYMKGQMPEERTAQVVYTIFYEAICSSTTDHIKTLNVNHTPIVNFLNQFGIDPDIDYPPDDFRHDLIVVSDILNQIGVIVKVQNLVQPDLCEQEDILWGKMPRFKTYIVNPSLTCQLIRAVYNLDHIDKYILGKVFESCVVSYLSTYRLHDDKLFFLDVHYKNGRSVELDAMIFHGDQNDVVYLFECKLKSEPALKETDTILSQSLKSFLDQNFPYSEVGGRYVIYNGDNCVKKLNDEDFLFTGFGKMLREYYLFDYHLDDILPSREDPILDDSFER